MNANRRTLLGAGAALALPAWMARAFAGQDATPGAAPAPRTPDFASAEKRARAVGKPLLVILTDPVVKKVEAGAVWGDFFAHATQDVWLDLALVEVACLPREALGKLERPSGRGALWAVLFETDDKGGGPRFVVGDLPAVSSSARTAEYGEQVRARTVALGRLVHAAVRFGPGAPSRRAAQSAASLSPSRLLMEEHGRREAALGPESPVRLVDLDRFAAEVRLQGPPARQEQLALAARMRLFEQDPPGARWHTGSDWCPPCGMGFVPAESRYFLQFYTR